MLLILCSERLVALSWAHSPSLFSLQAACSAREWNAGKEVFTAAFPMLR